MILFNSEALTIGLAFFLLFIGVQVHKSTGEGKIPLHTSSENKLIISLFKTYNIIYKISQQNPCKSLFTAVLYALAISLSFDPIKNIFSNTGQGGAFQNAIGIFALVLTFLSGVAIVSARDALKDIYKSKTLDKKIAKVERMLLVVRKNRRLAKYLTMYTRELLAPNEQRNRKKLLTLEMIIGFYEEMTEHCPLDHKIQTLCNCPQGRTMLDRSDWEIIKALPNFYRQYPNYSNMAIQLYSHRPN
ncbi:hypothetical protein [Maridesulfovibrio salexigens]|uniref:Uncharacterized protein n=1 Tax=Maridesulfovibrio salexigens (strain ATCC 14822 / DSM 2638 / NCIMB 8403 / VKM B-1763) TaxID=526222 RepID=C6BZF7_MARSD|nr:hypothetical protein [Maridesulfovibrio salexigens]ACS80794.1 hypothetical protein Desal_2740 [Maridesulfovibrio salexigens DSM 2638]